jgi:phosphoglycolate phosphatase
MVDKVIGELGVNRAKTLYVGDSEVDVMTAQNAGLDCLCVTWGFRDQEQQVEAGGTHFAHTAQEVFRFVTK